MKRTGWTIGPMCNASAGKLCRERDRQQCSVTKKCVWYGLDQDARYMFKRCRRLTIEVRRAE